MSSVPEPGQIGRDSVISMSSTANAEKMPMALLEASLDAGEIGIAAIDSDGIVCLWNNWIVRASGIAADAACGQPFAHLFPEIIGTRLEKVIADALKLGLSSALSSSLNRRLLPLTRRGLHSMARETMRQSIIVKPIAENGGPRICFLQVTDVTGITQRESILRHQARATQALAENYRLSEAHQRALVDNSADAILTFDESGLIGTYNAAAERMFGYTTQDIVNQTIGMLVPDLVPEGGGGTAKAAEAFLNQRHEATGRRANHSAFMMEISISQMLVDDERLFIAIIRDITERKRAEEEIKTQKEWLSTLINAMPDLVLFKDGEGRWLIANDYYVTAMNLQGIDYAGLTARDVARLSDVHRHVIEDVVATDEMAWSEGGPVAYEQSLPGPFQPDGQTGAPRVFDMLKVPLFHGDGSRKGLVVVGRDITDRKQAAAHIHHMAHHDSLTNLPNRVLFQERLRQGIIQTKRAGTLLALMFLDLDKFKDVNDTLGHDIGDMLLKAVARRLQRCVRETDTVARLGGDEFAIVLTNLADLHGAGLVAETVIRSIAEPFGLEDNEIVTSTSVGVTIYPNDGLDADQLLRNADLAMFRSKAEGRNTYHFYVGEMDAEVQARKAIERDLRMAMGTDQLFLTYQPLIDLTTGTITGAEALIRWRHPQSGLISPALFIPIAERTDLIFPLGRWVLQRACAQMRDWEKAGLPNLRVAVNLSAAQFRHQDLLTTVSDILEQTGIAPQWLQLEVTESAAMHNVDETIDILHKLRAIGMTISIDDFGTGYSSLNYLKRFPVDKLKIDRSFVTDIGAHPDNAAIVRAIINLGHSIGTKVNCEGVELHEQLEFLAEHKVDEVQGFLFSKPLEADDFADLLRNPPDWKMP